MTTPQIITVECFANIDLFDNIVDILAEGRFDKVAADVEVELGLGNVIRVPDDQKVEAGVLQATVLQHQRRPPTVVVSGL